MRLRTLAFVLIASIAFSSCASLKPKQTAVKLSVAVEQSLGVLQDAVRHLCNPSVPAMTPIRECTAESAALGLSTAKFRELSTAEGKAFDFIANTLGPSLSLWQPGQPAPKTFTELSALVKAVIDIAKTVVTAPQAQPIFASIGAIVDALGELGSRLGVGGGL